MKVIRVWSIGNISQKWLFYNALKLGKLKRDITYTLCKVYLPMAYVYKSSGMLLISLHFFIFIFCEELLDKKQIQCV